MPMKTIKVSEATNTQLDWLVAKCAIADGGYPIYMRFFTDGRPDAPVWTASCSWSFRPTTDWSQMGPIIGREHINFKWDGLTAGEWWAFLPEHRHPQTGPTSLIAAARCYVSSKLGDTVEVPEELT